MASLITPPVLNAKTFKFSKKGPSHSGNLNSGTPGDGENVFLHRGGVSAPLDIEASLLIEGLPNLNSEMPRDHAKGQ